MLIGCTQILKVAVFMGRIYNDVLIDAEHRLEQLAAEERDALTEARGLRKHRRRAEKRLLKPAPPGTEL
jgi:hypothetical protein